MGGATSIDRARRTPYTSWWPEEIPSDEEFAHAWKNLEAHNFKVDYIFTHCAPSPILDSYFPHYEHDQLTDFLGSIYRHVDFKAYFCGHYHQDICLNHQFYVCYNSIREITDKGIYVIQGANNDQ